MNVSRTVKAYAAPGPPVCHTVIDRHLCLSSGCERGACTASAPGFAQFCCVGCATGKGHSSDCDRINVHMDSLLVSHHVAVEKSAPDQAGIQSEAKKRCT